MKKFFVLILLIVSIAFAVGNWNHVIISFWPIPSVIDAPIFLVIFISFALGVIVGKIFNFFDKISLSKIFLFKKNKSDLNE